MVDGDLRTLAATGASSRARWTLTAATAGALGLLGAPSSAGPWWAQAPLLDDAPDLRAAEPKDAALPAGRVPI